MKDEASLRRYFKQEKAIQISSQTNNVFSIAALIIGALVLWINQDNFAVVIGAFIIILIALFHIRYLADAEIEGSTIRLKKLFSKPHRINIKDCKVLNTYKLGRSVYTSIEYQVHGSTINGLITNNNPKFMGKRRSAGEIIELAQDYFKEQNIV